MSVKRKRRISLLLTVALCLAAVLGLGGGLTPACADGPVVITIDPGHGHGPDDMGAQAEHGGVLYSECDLVLELAFYLREELEAYDNVRVVMTHEGGGQYLWDRVAIAADAGSDLLVSLHLDAPGSHAPETEGAFVLAASGNYAPWTASVGRAAGECILAELEKLGIANNGLLLRHSSASVYPDGSAADYYSIVRYGIELGVPSIIIEHCYITSDYEFDAFLSSSAKLRAMAAADAAGIAAYFGLHKSAARLWDVAGHWGEGYIARAAEAGWVNGFPDGSFVPDGPLTRGDFVTVLSRFSGEVLPGGNGGFSDVDAGSYFGAAVAWAANAGLVDGFPDGTFRPAEPVTREQMAHIIALYLRRQGYAALPVWEDGGGIGDLRDIGGWALEDVLFCYEAGLLYGRDSRFVPQGQATRAEACALLSRLRDYGG